MRARERMSLLRSFPRKREPIFQRAVVMGPRFRGDDGERNSPRRQREEAKGVRFTAVPAAILCAFALLPLAGKTQDLPPRAIRIIVPSPPGAAGDISARLIGAKLSESLRQPVVVENQAGASGAIGMSMLRRAAPDGTTVGVVIALAQTIDRIQNKKASFDIVKDFTPITAIANNPPG